MLIGGATILIHPFYGERNSGRGREFAASRAQSNSPLCDMSLARPDGILEATDAEIVNEKTDAHPDHREDRPGELRRNGNVDDDEGDSDRHGHGSVNCEASPGLDSGKLDL